MRTYMYWLCCVGCLLWAQALSAQNVAYIHGDVAADGTIPSGSAAAYDQMLLTYTGNTGCSQFKAMVESQGYSISQHYDQTTTLNAAFLDPFDVVIFGLHQKVWSTAEKTALDTWIRAGGGIMMYSDSAAGGKYDVVGIKNATGQTAVNNILSSYGMEVTVDQGGGIRAYTSPADSTNPVVWDNPVFEGEGVSPVAVDPNGSATALVPFDDTYKVSGSSISIDARNVTIANPVWACIAHTQVGNGNVIAIFDRQPMWNNGPGSDINEENNREILRRIIRYLARDYGNSSAWLDLVSVSTNGSLPELTYRQWSGGSGQDGYNYTAHNTHFTVQQKTNLVTGVWQSGSNWVEHVSTAPESGGETERTTVRLLPITGSPSAFARVAILPSTTGAPPSADAGMARYINETGQAWLEGSTVGATSVLWSKDSGPGTVTFADASSAQTTATFSSPGDYELRLTTGNDVEQSSDTVTTHVTASSNVVHAINCGGSAYSGNNGFSYTADHYFTGGHIDNFPGNAVANTGDDPLYNTARSSHSSYDIPVANGSYTVYYQFAETYWTANGARVFDTMIEGALVIDNLDLYATAPGKWVAYDLAFPATVSDGILNITFTASANNSLLNALVVIKE